MIVRPFQFERVLFFSIHPFFLKSFNFNHFDFKPFFGPSIANCTANQKIMVILFIIAIAVFAYMCYVLVKPEKF